MSPLFTIGHSSHTLETFLELLALHQIEAVADVRSQPYCRHFPHFSKPALLPHLKAASIGYVFLGRELGARREEPDVYVDGRVSFDLAAASPLFASGLARLQKGLSSHRIALLCAEKDPLDCHRTILVTRHAMRFAKAIHILADGTLEPHEKAERRLLERYEWMEPDLFLSQENRLASAYTRRGKEIAWREVETGDSGES